MQVNIGYVKDVKLPCLYILNNDKVEIFAQFISVEAYEKLRILSVLKDITKEATLDK